MIGQNVCQLCGQEAALGRFDYPTEAITVDCPICGSYGITENALLVIQSPHFTLSTKLSAYIRERTLDDKPEVVIFSNEPDPSINFIKPWITIDEIISTFPSTVYQRLDMSLINLSKLSKFAGDDINVTADDYPLFYVQSKQSSLKEQTFILQQLIDDGYISGRTVFPSKFTITAKGWNKIYDLEKVSTPRLKQAFIAMWFDASMDTASENGLKKAIKEAGYEPIKINDKEHNGKIDDEIISEIRRSQFIVCDFTGHRGGVYFEAGFAMGLGLPVIWTCRQDNIDELHFDTRQYNHIVWTDEDDLHRKLLNRIRATII